MEEETALPAAPEAPETATPGAPGAAPAPEAGPQEAAAHKPNPPLQVGPGAAGKRHYPDTFRNQ